MYLFNKTITKVKVVCFQLPSGDYKSYFNWNPFIKQETSEKSVMPEDPAKDLNFQEPIIDSLRAQKDDVSKIYML